MKKADIKVGAEYAVWVDRYMRAGTSAGSEGLLRGTVTGWAEQKFGKPALVKVTLAQPYESRYMGTANKGRVDWEIESRRVISTWDEHETAAKARKEYEQRAAVERRARERLMAENQAALRDLIPESLWPYWLRSSSVHQDGGKLTVGELLAIVQAVKG